MESDSTSDSELSYASDDGVIEDLFSEENDEINLENSIQILTTDDIVTYMKETIEFVSLVVQMRPPVTRVLLNHFKWNKEVLLERLFEDDREKLFKEAKIGDLFNESTDSFRRQRISEEEDCQICYTSFQVSELFSLECDHTFCFVCWKSYLHHEIVDLGKADIITCPIFECPILVDETMCSKILKDSRAQQIYQRLITQRFVEFNPLLAWCPNPECSNAVKVEYVQMQSVNCHCKTTFCLACKENWHSPMNCDLIKLWKSKCEMDTETAAWLISNTKDCPNCKTPIEKNGGCNHMSCTNGTCRYQFCWICRSPWQNHSACVSFRDDASGTQENFIIKRYLFHRDRYIHHQQSLNLETKLIADVSSKVKELDMNGVTSGERNVLLKSAEALTRCRRTLMYTYAFAYYLQKSNQTAIFEENQADLHHATEDLSDCLEHNMDTEDFSKLKIKVLDLFHYCENRRVVLEKHVREGYQNNSWDFISEVCS